MPIKGGGGWQGPGHSTRKNYLQDLVDGKDSHSHTWKWRKSLVEWSTCRLTISACNTWKVIHAKVKRPCRAINLAICVRAGELTQQQADKLKAEAQQSSLTESRAAHTNAPCPDGETTQSLPLTFPMPEPNSWTTLRPPRSAMMR